MLAVMAAAAIAIPPTPLTMQSMSAEEIATYTFLGTCVFSLLGGPSADQYATNARSSASKMPQGFPVDHVQLSGVDGGTCRVAYRGSNPDQVFKALLMSTDMPKGACEIENRSDKSVHLSCPAIYMRDGYEGVIQRGADGRIIGSITVTSPAIMLMPSNPKTSASHQEP